MKSHDLRHPSLPPASPPSRGAWIEMSLTTRLSRLPLPSPPSRGAWIEMQLRIAGQASHNVAPLAGGVD